MPEKDIRNWDRLNLVPEFSPEKAEAFRLSAQSILSSHLQGSHEYFPLPQTRTSSGASFQHILGLEQWQLPHLQLWKTALSQPVSSHLIQPEWLGGYALRQVPSQETLMQEEPLIVAGIRAVGDVLELYYGSFPDTSQLEKQTGVLNDLAVGVLSSGFDVLRHNLLRLWFAPRSMQGEDWLSYLTDEPLVADHLQSHGEVRYDSFVRQAFSVDKEGLQRSLLREGNNDAWDQMQVVRKGAPEFAVVELCRARVLGKNWHVYAAGHLHSPLAVPEKNIKIPSLFAERKLALAGMIR